VARQCGGQLGKQDNCQVAASLSLANHAARLPRCPCRNKPTPQIIQQHFIVTQQN